jgi:surface antigen
LAVNLLVLFAVFAFVIHHSSSAQVDSQLASTSTTSSSNTTQVNPLDQLSSSEIAVQVARMTGIYEATSVTNLADSQSATTNIVPSDNQVISKPTVISTAAKSKEDIVKYVTQPGDTVSALAVKYGVTSDSILWSNGLTSDSLKADQTIYIPPVTGIIYTVKSGDTASSLASTFSSNSDQITAFNDAELAGLTPGEQIVIPNGTKAAATPSYSSGTNYTFGYTPIYGSNGYDWGYCTWYVASQIAVPSNWGNASSWAAYAAVSGWNVSTSPKVGAIAQTAYAAGGQGHVAIVAGVSPDGSSILIKDMNNYGDGGGFGRVGSGWVSTSAFQHYIYH